MSSLPFRSPTLWDLVRYHLTALWYWTYSNVHMIKQTLNVLDFMWVHRIRPGLLADDHPWVTGRLPDTGDPVWPRNIVFASARKQVWRGPVPESDAEIVTRVGRFLAAMVQRSNVIDPEIPQGKSRRMPHAVNYIHGTVHYNGGFVLFNDYEDAMFHLSDSRFAREFQTFAEVERRELTIVLRERVYDPEEYAWFVAFVRAHLPWYANGNGPTKKRVLHGTPSPYPAVNPINGTWVDDLARLQRGHLESLVQPPIARRYFRGSYSGWQREYTFLERFHAWAQYLVTEVKGFQGGLVFTSRRVIEPENWKTYLETNGEWRAGYAVSHPFVGIARARARRWAGATK